MALCFPRKKVVLDIVAHGDASPQIVMRDGWTILRITEAQMIDRKAFDEVMNTLAQLLGSPAPTRASWDDDRARLRKAMLATMRDEAA